MEHVVGMGKFGKVPSNTPEEEVIFFLSEILQAHTAARRKFGDAPGLFACSSHGIVRSYDEKDLLLRHAYKMGVALLWLTVFLKKTDPTPIYFGGGVNN
jgi:hypothetical protein